MKRFHFICRILHNGTPQKPFEGIGNFVPKDWKEQRIWEDEQPKIHSYGKKVIAFMSKVFPKQKTSSEIGERKQKNEALETEENVTRTLSLDEIEEEKQAVTTTVMVEDTQDNADTLKENVEETEDTEEEPRKRATIISTHLQDSSNNFKKEDFEEKSNTDKFF
ncbi:hypothetical protein JCM21714_2123 [Gracilibacillus boraciitolerans JCM 21714]|uniref:Uncharacterized protein n=1 Tax=Gracilibacillus boraciitolerans JCM 21714 TaxID=1298598 RepID=W4VIW2_9BACI|nr:hypothetical protein [Gracilibacillus boraciitolerans]GAE93086.1 hypothetical protein JCM21714_2123 [Gracilibacillus boraciitolerans JCM 21714]